MPEKTTTPAPTPASASASAPATTVDVTVEPIQRFLDSLTDKQRKVFEIAKEHMESSYDIKRSNGYLTWLKDNKE